MLVSDAGADVAGVAGGVGVSEAGGDDGSVPIYLDGETVEVVGGGLAGAALVLELSGVGADGADGVAGVAGGGVAGVAAGAVVGGTTGGAVPEASGGGELVAGVEGVGGVPAEASGAGVEAGTGMTLV